MGRLLERPDGFGEILWWVSIAAVACLILVGTQPLARRLLVFGSLVATSVEFPSRPPSRLAVAWSLSDPADVRRRLDLANRSEWTPELQTDRAVLAATLGVLEQRRRQSVVVFRVGDDEVSASVVESEIPGYLQLTKRDSAGRRRLLALAAGSGAAALLATAALARGPSSSSTSGDSSTAAPSAPAPPTLGRRPSPSSSVLPTAGSGGAATAGDQRNRANSKAATATDAGAPLADDIGPSDRADAPADTGTAFTASAAGVRTTVPVEPVENLTDSVSSPSPPPSGAPGPSAAGADAAPVPAVPDTSQPPSTAGARGPATVGAAVTENGPESFSPQPADVDSAEDDEGDSTVTQPREDPPIEGELRCGSSSADGREREHPDRT